MNKNSETFNFFGKQITQEQLKTINKELDRHQKAYNNQSDNSIVLEHETYQTNNSDYYPAGCSDEYIDRWS